MERYEVYQVYASTYAVHLGKKLDRRFYKGVYQANNAFNAVGIASRKTGIPQLCLCAELVKESK